MTLRRCCGRRHQWSRRRPATTAGSATAVPVAAVTAERAFAHAASSGPGVSARNERSRSISSGMTVSSLNVHRSKSNSPSCARRAARARDSRDLAVPGAIPRATAISSWLSSAQACSSRTSRWSRFSAASAPAIRGASEAAITRSSAASANGPASGGRRREPRVQLEQLLLVPPVAAHDVGRDPVQPRPQRAARRLVAGPPPVRGREHLGRQVLGQGGADSPRDEPVHRREVLAERVLEVLRRHDGGSRLPAGGLPSYRLFLVHT